MITPLAYVESLRIGSVDSVSPDEIRVLLDIEAPTDVALNTGVPRPFPRVNSYVLIPSEPGFIVGQVEFITIERSQYPKRKGLQDFGVIDLPFPLRKIALNPLGVLKVTESNAEGEPIYKFSRGIEIYPTVGDPVLLPSPTQLKAIVESGEKRRVNIGISPLADNAVVSVDPDRLFGRHLAILGNTGSGKSCSVAGIIRWSIEAAKLQKSDNYNFINSRFIILDPNGEYSYAFSDLENVRLFAAEPKHGNVKQLRVPLWFWNSSEWIAFTQANGRAQRPTLIQALRVVRDGQLDIGNATSHDMRRYLRSLINLVRIEISKGSPWSSRHSRIFKENLTKWKYDLKENESFSSEQNKSLVILKKIIDKILKIDEEKQFPVYPQKVVEIFLNKLKEAFVAFGGIDSDLPLDADVPRHFTGEQLLKSIEMNAELMGTTEYVETMIMRIRTLLSDSRLKPIISDNTELTLEQWLNEYVCESNSDDGSITVIDLSLVPAEVIHIITAVIARMTLEALQRYRKINNGKTLPTVLVIEEAHTFIKKYQEDEEETSASSMCTRVFEKIAREGRKFGLGLVLSSQRPSELSPTVLSQCNTFLLHRISNDRDQELVRKLLPDNLRGLLRELPILPPRNAILLGWASELPVLVQMNYLDEKHRPKSDDPKYWDVWTGNEKIYVNWKAIADDWQQRKYNKRNNEVEQLDTTNKKLDDMDYDDFEKL